MPVEILTIPCRQDNYAFLIHDSGTGETALVDAPETAPLAAALDDRGWQLSTILLTHHHTDHIDGVADLVAGHGPRVIGAAADAHRLPPLDAQVAEGDRLTVAGQEVQIFDVSGHTVGHIAFYMPEAAAVFTADSLMALGCGRVFEGTMDQMWESLSKLAALPGETTVYSGHEYTAANARFALTIEPTNPDLQARVAEITRLRDNRTPTVPSNLGTERSTNPFLRAGVGSVKSALGMENAPDAAVFAEIRGRKDRF